MYFVDIRRIIWFAHLPSSRAVRVCVVCVRCSSINTCTQTHTRTHTVTHRLTRILTAYIASRLYSSPQNPWAFHFLPSWLQTTTTEVHSIGILCVRHDDMMTFFCSPRVRERERERVICIPLVHTCWKTVLVSVSIAGLGAALFGCINVKNHFFPFSHLCWSTQWT